jgi:hypothetical protein
MDRETCIAFIEQTYFGSVQAGDIDAVMRCFAETVEVVIRHGDHPERFFKLQPARDETDLRSFYDHLCGNYDVSFSDFAHIIDGTARRAACHFKVRLCPKPNGLYADAGEQELRNCNFFEFEDSLISHMIIYYANPQAKDAPDHRAATPTGYPRS